MTTTENYTAITIEAGSDLSATPHQFVLVASDGQVDLVASAGGDADGVLMNKPAAAGRAAEVAIAGVAKVVAGSGGITRGQKVQSDATGKGILAASGDHVLGRALTSAAEGELFSILLNSSHHILA